MMRLARHLVLLQQQGYAATLAAAEQLLPFTEQQRSYQAAVEQASQSDITSQQPSQQTSQADRSQDKAWAPHRSLPPPSYYGVQILIKAHEPRFVKMASTVIRDLALVNFAPKSRNAMPGSLQGNSKVPWVNLALPKGDAALPTLRTHFTVMRSPHVFKTSREQFARFTHQRRVEYSTSNLSELNWFLDSIKLYKFIGCELEITVSSSSYLLPTSSEQQAAAEEPLLQQHKQRFAHLFGAAAPSSNSSAGGNAQHEQDTSYAALQQSMQGLRQAVHEGLLQQRMQLAGNAKYKRWLENPKNAPAVPAAAARPTAEAVADLISQQVQGTNMADTDSYQKQQALLAAVDKALLQMKKDVLDRHKFFPYLMAFYKLGQQNTPPAEWMHAMLKFGKMRQQEVESSQPAAALELYQQYGQVTQTLLLQLLQQWYQTLDKQARQDLGLPDDEMVQDMLANIGRQKSAEAASGKAAVRGTNAAATNVATAEGQSEEEADRLADGTSDIEGSDFEEVVTENDLSAGTRRGRGSGDSRRQGGWGSGSRVDRYTPGDARQGPRPSVDSYRPSKVE